MIPIDLPPKVPQLWTPPKPALILPDRRVIAERPAYRIKDKKEGTFPHPFPPVLGGALPPWETLYDAQSTGTLTIPAGIQAGDVAYIVQYRRRIGQSAGYPAASGFTSIHTHSYSSGGYFGSVSTMRASFKLLNGSEGGQGIGVAGGSAQAYRQVLGVFRPGAPINTLTVYNALEIFTSSGSSTRTPSVPPSGPSVLIGAATDPDTNPVCNITRTPDGPDPDTTYVACAPYPNGDQVSNTSSCSGSDGYHYHVATFFTYT